MDAESLAQIEQIVTTAVSGAEGRLRKETAALGTSLRQEIGEKFEEAKRHTDEKFKEAERHTDQKFEEALRHTDEKFAEAERHSGVLYEDTLHKIALLAEGHQALHQKIERLETRMEDGFARIEREFLETRALIQLSYRQLQDRVEALEQRVQLIEKRLGLSN